LVPKALYFSAPSGGADPVLVADFAGQTLTGNVRFGSEAAIGLVGVEWLLLTQSGHLLAC
jgi:hypothetical protein